MTTEEKNVFENVINQFKNEYPNSQIRFEDDFVYAYCYNREDFTYEERHFNTAGWNLLWCIKELVELLKEKLR